ncbi:carbamoyltransferase HypF [Kordiimonas sp.]|uniref:carbamoyltransferase HypF n=1 Tax=Kordiimonas sp. TaxID=1970157 RepID=UPI003A92DEC9
MLFENQEIRVKGTVQGVGFRPTVFRLAHECQINGEVFNDAEGVVINLAGSSAQIEAFVAKLRLNAPPLSKIDGIECRPTDKGRHYSDFRITESSKGQTSTEVTADAATCSACADEVMNPSERRYLYPFTNCTHCGPRLSIIQDIPYDRAGTTMRAFPMCKACASEYENPLDRRFHAQPVACHECGPRIFIPGECEGPTGPAKAAAMRAHTEAVLVRTVRALHAGDIVAIKGIGGFHLCCDASNHEAVRNLRRRKQRYAKPFALMCHERERISAYCQLGSEEWKVLSSPAAPIVLLDIRRDPINMPILSPDIAPGSNLLGFMLPYTPLHALLCQRFGGPLVMTSGNVSGEPQIIDNEEALLRLGHIADMFVCHDRDIANRIDDSVVRYMAGKPRVMRRARGYAPRSIQLPGGFDKAPPILAYGAELKATFCMLRKGSALVSQHQGDLEDLRTCEDYEKNLSLYQELFEFTPTQLATDMHPDYLSSKRGQCDADQGQLPLHQIQHHHAHIASAMAEGGLSIDHPPVLGIALDGLGFGADNTLWGGEVLLATYEGFERLASLKPVPMPGGAMAARQPWRNALAHVLAAMSYGDFVDRFGEIPLATVFADKPIGTVMAMMARGLNCPPASSAGRLFDAVAAAVGVYPDLIQFEGQAAIELEMLADVDAVIWGTVTGAYQFTVRQKDLAADGLPGLEVDAATIWLPLLEDIRTGVSAATIATRFHAGLVAALVTTVERLRADHTFGDVILSGGCLQNRILFEALNLQLSNRQFRCISHAEVPANDGGIALGQAVIAAARIAKDTKDIKRNSASSTVRKGSDHVFRNTGENNQHQ